MRIDWKARRTQVVLAAAVVVLIPLSIADGAFTTWYPTDYIGWWVLLPLGVLLAASLVTYLVRAWGKRD